MSDLVSIIIPTFNRADFICRALQSVANQSYRPIEIIIVDDGSKDSTQGVVEEWMEENSKDPLGVYYNYQENKGVSAARNVGIKKATGKYVMFLDSDDELLPFKIKNSVAAYQKDLSIDLVYSRWIQRNDLEERIAWGPNLEEDCSVTEVVNRYLWTSSALYRKDIIDQYHIFWQEDLKRSEDRVFGAQYVKHCKKAVKISEPDVVYNQFSSANSISAQMGSREKDLVISLWNANRILKKMVEEENHPTKKSRVIKGLSKRDLNAARRALACGANALSRKIIRSNPQIFKFEFKNTLLATIYWIMSWIPAFLLAPLIQKATQFKLKYLLKHP